jgi:TonB family protein
VKPAAAAAPAGQPIRQAVPIAQVPANKSAPLRIYSRQDASVVPPSVVRQSFAPLADVFALRQGAVEIVVDETGTVVAATTYTAVNTVYDRIALATAKSWRYRPAMLNGVAVKFRMVVRIEVKPSH